MKSHRSFLKEYVEDVFNSQPIPLFYHQRTEIDTEAEVDEWVVDKILGHKKEGEKIRFLTAWTGHDAEEATWVDARDFLPRYNEEFVAYCKRNHLKLDIVSHLG